MRLLTPALPVALPRPEVFVADAISIPGWVVDLSSYRQWAISDSFPQSSRFSYLDGVIFVDPSREELFTHNQVKGAIAVAVANLLGSNPPGVYAFDRMLLSNPEAGLVTEPDGLFFFWETVRSGRLQLIEGSGGIVELIGSPDMKLEVVSKNSVSKDTKSLRDLYWKAGVAEYWLVDARGPEPVFQILQRSETNYVPVEPTDGWAWSAVFGREFQIAKQMNPLGQPQFVVNVRNAPST